jgi:hypothetical protein
MAGECKNIDEAIWSTDDFGDYGDHAERQRRVASVTRDRYCYFCGGMLRKSKRDDNQVCVRCNAMYVHDECMPLRREATGDR